MYHLILLSRGSNDQNTWVFFLGGRTPSQCKLKSEFTMKGHPFFYILKGFFFMFLHWPSQVWSFLFVCVFHLPFDTPNNDTTFQRFRDLPVIRRLQDVNLVQVPEVIFLLQLTSAAWSGDVKLLLRWESDGLLRWVIPGLGDPPPKNSNGFFCR